jgi:hypothetical protein
LCKPYGIKPRCYWEHFGECIWEHFGKLKIFWEHIQNKKKKKTKKNSAHPTPLPKGKNRAQHECMLSLPIGWMQFLFPKTVGHHFGPGLIPGQKLGNVLKLSLKSGKDGTWTPAAGTKICGHSKFIGKVRKTWHQNPLEKKPREGEGGSSPIKH